MKKVFKKIIVCMLCFGLLQGTWTILPQALAVQAATVKNGLKKESGNIRYYKKGKKIKNQWKTVKGYKYYFNSKGNAYKADGSYLKYNVLVKTIKGKKYGFDKEGHMVTGLRMAATSEYGALNLYYFNKKTGAYDQKTTTKYRNAAKPATTKNKRSAAAIKKLLGKPLKKEVSKEASCFLDGNGTDITYVYKYVILNVFRPAGTKTELVESVSIRI